MNVNYYSPGNIEQIYVHVTNAMNILEIPVLPAVKFRNEKIGLFS